MGHFTDIFLATSTIRKCQAGIRALDDVKRPFEGSGVNMEK